MMHDDTTSTRRRTETLGTERSTIETAAMLVGATFLLVGILGFVPGITTHFGDMTFSGHHSRSQLLGLFQVSILHNLVHLAFGVVGIVASRRSALARAFLVYGGVAYLVLWIYGLVIDKTSSANFVPLDRADDWLHFLLGVAMVGLGLSLGGARRRDRVRRDVHLS